MLSRVCLAELELQKKNEELTKQHLEEEQAKAEAEAARLKVTLEKREKEFEDAVEGMPGTWTILALKASAVGMDILETGVSSMIGSGFSSTIGAAAKAFGQLGGTDMLNSVINGGSDMIKDVIKGQGESAPEKPKRMSPQTTLVYSCLMNHVETIEKGQKELFDEKGFNKEVGHVNAMRSNFSWGENSLADPDVDPKLKERVEPFYNAVKSTLDKVDMNDDTNVPAVKEGLKAHHRTTLELQAEASAVMGAPMQRATPEEVKANNNQAGRPQEEESMEAMALRNAQAKVETTKEMFRKTEEDYAETNKNLTATNQMLNKSLVKISELDTSTASLRDILVMLKAGLALLATLKDQWVTLTQFFQKMANLVKLPAEKTTNFTEVARDARGDDGSIGMGEITKNQIFVYAREAVTVGYVVQRLATGYVEFSDKHLMGPIAKLPELMVLDKEEDKSKIQEYKTTIMKGCKEAISELKLIQMREKREFDMALKARMITVKEEFSDLTDTIPTAVKQEIRAAVQSGMQSSQSMQENIDEFL